MTYKSTSSFTCNDQDLLSPSLTDICTNSTVFVFMSLLNALIGKNEKISGRCERVVPVERPDYEYDFVVIGGGAAGSVAAGRLSEIQKWKVLLLEAGPDEPVGAEVPGFAMDFIGTEIAWKFKTSNESNACLSKNGSCTWSSGKNLGGSTAHNAMIYLRGNPTDYNNWADQGNEGWTWEEVEKFFLKAEDNGEIERVGRKHHRTGGPLHVERFPHVPPIGHAILQASREVGYGVSEDLNGDTKSGFSIIQATNKKGVRRSSSRAYLWPIRNRKNLHVSLNSHATKLIIKNRKAVGVEYVKDGKLRRVYATREVIVSCGVVKSPHILLLSGIGPKDHLESLGVKVAKDLPGVGKNLHDHVCANISFTANEPDRCDNDWAVAEEYLAFQNGPLSSIGPIQVVGLLPSNATGPHHPDIEVYFKGYRENCAPGKIGALQSTGLRPVTLQPVYMHPKSRGKITLASKDPFEDPVIWVNYLDDPDDVDRTVDAMRMSLALLDTKALRGYNFTMTNAPLEACSNHEFESYEYWACVARQTDFPLCHPAGTCKMGPFSDPMAVVDPRLRVHGIKGLRIADTSIMPQVTSSNTAAPAMMIGERVAEFTKEDWGWKSGLFSADHHYEL